LFIFWAGSVDDLDAQLSRQQIVLIENLSGHRDFFVRRGLPKNDSLMCDTRGEAVFEQKGGKKTTICGGISNRLMVR
jgi:hypothetical protein